MTWAQMVRIEPKLKTLLMKARSCKSTKNFCANRIWYGNTTTCGLKGELVHLVGWSARDARLRTSEAYDLAYSKIYNALPDCRHDGLC
jgi:hypothetical protein